MTKTARTELIKIAYENPQLREDLLKIITLNKVAMPAFDSASYISQRIEPGSTTHIEYAIYDFLKDNASLEEKRKYLEKTKIFLKELESLEEPKDEALTFLKETEIKDSKGEKLNAEIKNKFHHLNNDIAWNALYKVCSEHDWLK